MTSSSPKPPSEPIDGAPVDIAYEAVPDDEQGDYEYLRDAVVEALNPADDDVAEPYIMVRAVQDAAAYIALQLCLCTPAMIEDHDACARCRVLGQLGCKRVKR